MCEINKPASPGDFNFVEFVGEMHIHGLTFGKDVFVFPPSEWGDAKKALATKGITPGEGANGIVCVDMPDDVADLLRKSYAPFRARLIKTPEELFAQHAHVAPTPATPPNRPSRTPKRLRTQRSAS